MPIILYTLGAVRRSFCLLSTVHIVLSWHGISSNTARDADSSAPRVVCVL